MDRLLRMEIVKFGEKVLMIKVGFFTKRGPNKNTDT